MGGATAAGGGTAVGGALASGGAPARAGSSAVGGNLPTGGAAAGGGVPSAGGSDGGALPTQGGRPERGGTSGANPGSGGTAVSTAGDGGSTSVGGAGGASAAAGSSGAGVGGTRTGTGGADAGSAGAVSAGTGGSSDTSGCPLTLEGFATLDGDGQNGTYGGLEGETVTVTSQAELERYATAAEPFTIRIQGAITLAPKGTEVRVASDKTLIGVGTSGEIVAGGFRLTEGVHNVIFRNLVIRDTLVEDDWEGKTQDWDGIQMDTAHHVWIDHCHFHHIGDGIIDSRKDTTYLTVSWSILSDHNKAFGIGWTDNLVAQMTIHHNILRDLNQRNPSTDNVLRAHLFNNWLLRISSYGNYARGGTNMVLENSVFDQVNDPHYYDDGSLVASGNLYRNTTGQQEASSGDYSFFNPSGFYSYSLDPADQVEQLLTRCAGPRPELGQ